MTIPQFIWTLTVAWLRTLVPSAPIRPLAILRWRSDFGGGGTGWQIDAHDIVVIVADANATAERGRRIRAGAPPSLHRETAGLRAGRPGGPGGPTAVNGAICYSDTSTRANLPTVLRWRIVAFSGLALARVDILRTSIRTSIFAAQWKQPSGDTMYNTIRRYKSRSN